jgi:hypothetical protein
MSDPLFNLQTLRCLRRFASPNQQPLASQHPVSPMAGEIALEGYLLPTSKCHFVAWKFWKYRYKRNKSLSPPLLRANDLSGQRTLSITVSLPITRNSQCSYLSHPKIHGTYSGEILFLPSVYGKYCGSSPTTKLKILNKRPKTSVEKHVVQQFCEDGTTTEPLSGQHMDSMSKQAAFNYESTIYGKCNGEITST